MKRGPKETRSDVRLMAAVWLAVTNELTLHERKKIELYRRKLNKRQGVQTQGLDEGWLIDRQTSGTVLGACRLLANKRISFDLTLERPGTSPKRLIDARTLRAWFYAADQQKDIYFLERTRPARAQLQAFKAESAALAAQLKLKPGRPSAKK
jgi:hypothetical protein